MISFPKRALLQGRDRNVETIPNSGSRALNNFCQLTNVNVTFSTFELFRIQLLLRIQLLRISTATSTFKSQLQLFRIVGIPQICNMVQCSFMRCVEAIFSLSLSSARRRNNGEEENNKRAMRRCVERSKAKQWRREK